MKLFLCGGGSGTNAIEATKKFGKLIDKNKPLLYVPLAMQKERYDSCLEWITKEMNSINVVNIEMVRSGEELASKDYNKYCGIFIGGGNTYKLLNDIKNSGAFNKILKYLQNDGIVFGGSAGAIIFGNDINTCLYEDDNDSVGLKDTSGFNLFNDISLLCHFNKNEEQTRKNLEYLNFFSKNKKILYLPEEDTILIDNNHIELIGNKKICCLENGEIRLIDSLDNIIL